MNTKDKMTEQEYAKTVEDSKELLREAHCRRELEEMGKELYRRCHRHVATTCRKSHRESTRLCSAAAPRAVMTSEAEALAEDLAPVFENREQCFAVLARALRAYHHSTPAGDDHEEERKIVTDLIDAIELAECL